MVTDEHLLNSCVKPSLRQSTLAVCTHTHVWVECWWLKVKNKEIQNRSHASVSNMLLPPLTATCVCAQDEVIRRCRGVPTWVQPESSKFHMIFGEGWRNCAVFTTTPFSQKVFYITPGIDNLLAEAYGYRHHLKNNKCLTSWGLKWQNPPKAGTSSITQIHTETRNPL